MSWANNPRRNIAADLEETIDGFANAAVAPAERAKYFDDAIRARIIALVKKTGTARVPATTIALWWSDPAAIDEARRIIADKSQKAVTRAALLRGLAEKKDAGDIPAFAAFIEDATAPGSFASRRSMPWARWTTPAPRRCSSRPIRI